MRVIHITGSYVADNIDSFREPEIEMTSLFPGIQFCFHYSTGARAWYKNGQCHRDDGPAVEWEHGYMAWFKNDELLREFDPALHEDDHIIE